MLSLNCLNDYCNTILAGAPMIVREKLQWVLNAAARVGTLEFDRGFGQILYDRLHWLDVPDWVLVLACNDSSPVPERPRTTVSVGALHPGLQC